MKQFLKDSDIFFLLLCELSPDGALILETTGEILHANPSAHLMFCYPEDKLTGIDFDTLLVEEEDRKVISDFLESDRFSEKLNDVVMMKKNGEILFADISLARVETDERRLTAVFIHDVSQKRRFVLESERNRMLVLDILNAIEDGISLLDRDLNIVRTNTWMEKLYKKYLPLEGKKCYEVYQQRTSPCPWCPCLLMLKTGKPCDVVVPYPSEKTPTRWMELFAYPLRDLEGNIVGIVEYVRDITKQKILTDLLVASEKKFKSFFENLGVCTYRATRDGRFLDINQAGVSLFGYTKKEFLNLIASDLYENPEDRKIFIHEISERGEVYDYPLRLKRKDGTVISCRITATLIYDIEGKNIGQQGIIRDVTEIERLRTDLAQSEKKYRGFFENSAVFTYITNQEGNIVDVNMAAVNLLGYDKDEFVKLNVFDIYEAPEERNRFIKEIEAKGFVKDFLIHLKRKDGTVLTCLDTATLIRDEKGAPLIYQGIIRDVTEKLRMENALKEKNQELEFLNRIAKIFLSASEEEIYGETLNVILEVMKSEFGVFGYIDENGDLVCPTITRHIWKKCQVSDKTIVFPRETWGGIWGKSMFEKKSLVVNEDLKVPSGHIPVTRAMSVPIVFNDQVIGNFTVANKKTDYVEYDRRLLEEFANFVSPILYTRLEKMKSDKAKAQLEKERVRFETLLSQTDTEVIITDINGSIEFVNPAFEKITGYSFNEVKGQNPRILKSGQQDETFYKDLWDTITAGKSWDGRFINKRKDGSLYHEEAHIFPIFDAAGTIQNFAAIKRDITQEVTIEEQLQQTAKLEAIGQLVGGIAHDFNNVLTSIQGFTELGLLKLSPQQPLWNELSEIHTAAKQAARITQQLLGFSRKQMISPKVVSVNQIIEEMTPLLNHYIGEDINMNIVLTKERDIILADRVQVEQCLLNLVINARDAIRGKKDKEKHNTITIETLPALIGDTYLKSHVGIEKVRYLVIAISDTGIGMDKETLSKVFEPFFTTKPKGMGTGLGCSTVFGIVKQNKGNVRVYSEPGVGTTVKIYWPSAEKDAVVETPKSEDTAVFIKGNETILVVEDDRGIREFVIQALEASGYTVYAAENGPKALNLVKDKNLSPDLLFTDVIMPGMSGKELSEALSPQIPHLKTLFSSGYTENQIFQKGILEPETYFLHKPYNLRDLLKKVRTVLNSN